jgi:hypothetical protein
MTDREILLCHEIRELQGSIRRLLLDRTHELETGLAALRKGRVAVTEQRIERTIDAFQTFMTELNEK